VNALLRDVVRRRHQCEVDCYESVVSRIMGRMVTLTVHSFASIIACCEDASDEAASESSPKVHHMDWMSILLTNVATLCNICTSESKPNHKLVNHTSHALARTSNFRRQTREAIPRQERNNKSIRQLRSRILVSSQVEEIEELEGTACRRVECQHDSEYCDTGRDLPGQP
jgi:hypothetical protein